MEETGIRKEVIEEIRNFARKYQVKKVILFGSRARGDYKRTSDIDIAVSGGDFAEFALDVEEETSTLLEFDIVNLDREMQDELREAIEREGKLLYEICFEQSWKMMKEILEMHGYEEGATGSPKIILKTAYKAGMIKDEHVWLEALQARNNVTHSYNQKIALGIVADAKEEFYQMFCDLKKEIEEKWL